MQLKGMQFSYASDDDESDGTDKCGFDKDGYAYGDFYGDYTIYTYRDPETNSDDCIEGTVIHNISKRKNLTEKLGWKSKKIVPFSEIIVPEITINYYKKVLKIPLWEDTVHELDKKLTEIYLKSE